MPVKTMQVSYSCYFTLRIPPRSLLRCAFRARYCANTLGSRYLSDRPICRTSSILTTSQRPSLANTNRA